jgi:hypothetical protein
MAKAPKQGAGKYGTNGGNGGYSRRKPVDMGLGKPLKLSHAGVFAATGKTKKKDSP